MGQHGGFGLIDAILMMVVVGVGCAGLMTAFTIVNRQTGDANMTTTAAFLAQEQLDRMVADKLYRGYNFIVPNNYPSPVTLPAPFAGYARATTIREVMANDPTRDLPGSGLKRIDIDLQWGTGGNQQLRLSTLVTRY